MGRRGFLKRVAALTLFVLTAAFLDGSYRHTDDGCAVETHCLACQRAHAPVTPGVERPVVQASLSPEAAVEPTSDALPGQAVVAVRDNRGPPHLS